MEKESFAKENEEEFASREREKKRQRDEAFAKDSWKHASGFRVGLLPLFIMKIFSRCPTTGTTYLSTDIYLGSHLASTSIDLSTPFFPPSPLSRAANQCSSNASNRHTWRSILERIFVCDYPLSLPLPSLRGEIEYWDFIFLNLHRV